MAPSLSNVSIVKPFFQQFSKFDSYSVHITSTNFWCAVSKIAWEESLRGGKFIWEGASFCYILYKSTLKLDYKRCWGLTWNLQRWMSIGNALNFMGHMKVILVAKAYIRWCSSSSHTPSNFESTLCVSKAFKLSISTSGSQRLRRICRLTAVNLLLPSSCKAIFEEVGVVLILNF